MMSTLAERAALDAAAEAASRKRSLALKLVVAVVFLLLCGAVWWSVKGMKTEAPKRQVAKISILPDTPPPPPPPPKEEKKELPKDEPKQVMRDEQPKPAEAPKASEQLKMEGAAGDGPSAFAAGSVAKDYAGGAPTTGGSAGPAGTPADRAQERFYGNTARQLLQGEIERHLKSEAESLTATFSVWLTSDGAIQRFELTPSGNDANDNALRAALDETRRQFKLPPPPALALSQPLRFRLSVRPQA
jgi:periplasmic protein TonB